MLSLLLFSHDEVCNGAISPNVSDILSVSVIVSVMLRMMQSFIIFIPKTVLFLGSLYDRYLRWNCKLGLERLRDSVCS
jgi:hypothetical protein